MEIVLKDKERLLQSVLDYGVAINNSCYESEYGAAKGMEEWDAETKRLWEEIKNLVDTL